MKRRNSPTRCAAPDAETSPWSTSHSTVRQGAREPAAAGGRGARVRSPGPYASQRALRGTAVVPKSGGQRILSGSGRGLEQAPHPTRHEKPFFSRPQRPIGRHVAIRARESCRVPDGQDQAPETKARWLKSPQQAEQRGDALFMETPRHVVNAAGPLRSLA